MDSRTDHLSPSAAAAPAPRANGPAPLSNRARIVFTDVDGTLLNDAHRPCPEAAATIARLGRAHVPFVLVSARMPEALYPIQRRLGFSGPVVCYSGAYALDEKGGELLSRPIPLARAIEAKRIVAEVAPDVCCMTYGYHIWAVDDRRDPRVANEERIVECESVEAPVERAFAETGGIHKLLLVGDPETIASVRERLPQELADLTVVLSSPILCEIMAGGVSKAEGVGVVCRHVGLDVSEAMAFGDGHNDVEMLRAVPESYAMANADAYVRAQARHVTRRSNDENGLASELECLLG